ncbi:MAG: hypothetical protein Q7W05_01750 [Deltaproteobacteria bacterium]|nr:hypothetical protein [Deltaproteobacteria bacterium]
MTNRKYSFDPSRLVYVLLNRALLLNLIGRSRQGLEGLERGLALARGLGDLKAQAECLQQLSQSLAVLSRFQ